MVEVKRMMLEEPKVEQLLVAAEEMAFYIHNHHPRFKAIIVGGAGSQPAAYMVKWQWKRLFPKEVLPPFFALGQVRQGTTRNILDAGAEEFGKQILARFPKLKKCLDGDVFVLEEFASGGRHIQNLESALRSAGFKGIKKGVMCIRDWPMRQRVADLFDYAYAFSRHPPEFDLRRRTLIRELLDHRSSTKLALGRNDSVEVQKKRKEMVSAREKLKSFRNRSKGIGR